MKISFLSKFSFRKNIRVKITAASSDILSGLAEDLHNMILEFKI